MTSPRLVRLLAWLCLVVIAALSLVGPSLRPVTDLPHDVEHAAIFALAGLAIGVGYPAHALRNMLWLTLFAGAVELAQLYVPGRHARWIDFLVDAVAACVGVALAFLAARIFRRAVPRSAAPR
jgi:VanZ family protein